MPEFSNVPHNWAVQRPAPVQASEDPLDVQRYIAMFRRRLRLFVGVVLFVFLSILVFTLLQTPLYTSTASVVIESRKENVVASQEVLSDLGADSGVIDTEVEVLRSRELTEKVVQKLKLDQDPEFNPTLESGGPLKSLTGGIKGLFGAAAPDRARPDEAAIDAATVDAVMKRAGARRVALSSVMSVSFQSESREKAARIANAYVNEYIADQLATKLNASSDANGFIGNQLREVGQEVVAAEAEVARYRTANGLLSAQGATLTEQEISTYNQQLATVRATQAEEEARLRTARRQLAAGSDGQDVGEALDSDVIKSLRGKRAEVSGRVADLSTRYGPRHPDLLRARGELADIDNQIQAEIRRIVSNLEARVTVAQERTRSMQSSLGQARGALASTTSAAVQLADLERKAQSLRSNQEKLLQRYQEITSQQGTQRPDARIVSRATLPKKPSSPKVMVNLVLGLVVSLAAGAGAVFLLSMLDTGLGTTDDIERRLGIAHIGSLPLMASVATPQDRHTAPIDYVIEKPLSAFAEG